MNSKKIIDQENSQTQKQILNLSLETYKTVNSIFGKIFIFSLPLIILFPLYPFMLLETNLPWYEIERIERQIGLAVGLFFIPIVAIFVHRHIILKEENYESWYFLLGFFKGRYWKFMINTLMFIMLYSLILLLILTGRHINFTILYVVIFLLVYLQARLSLCFPMIATNQKGWIIKSFKLTKNLGWSYPIALFAILFPVVFLQALFAALISRSDLLADIILLGFIVIVLRIYMVSLLAVFFSKVYLIVTENKI